MDREVGQIEEERILPSLLNKIERHEVQPIRQVLVLLSLDLQAFHLVRRMIATPWATSVPFWNLHIETLIQWPRLIVTKVPLAENASAITVRLEGFGQRHLLQWQCLQFFGA